MPEYLTRCATPLSGDEGEGVWSIPSGENGFRLHVGWSATKTRDLWQVYGCILCLEIEGRAYDHRILPPPVWRPGGVPGPRSLQGPPGTVPPPLQAPGAGLNLGGPCLVDASLQPSVFTWLRSPCVSVVLGPSSNEGTGETGWTSPCSSVTSPLHLLSDASKSLVSKHILLLRLQLDVN